MAIARVCMPKGLTVDNTDIRSRFTYHAPRDGQAQIYEGIRFRVREVAEHINDVVPDSREKSLAITALEEAVMWANAGVARNG